MVFPSVSIKRGMVCSCDGDGYSVAKGVLTLKMEQSVRWAVEQVMLEGGAKEKRGRAYKLTQLLRDMLRVRMDLEVSNKRMKLRN
jgi:hypothetical protein